MGSLVSIKGYAYSMIPVQFIYWESCSVRHTHPWEARGSIGSTEKCVSDSWMPCSDSFQLALKVHVPEFSVHCSYSEGYCFCSHIVQIGVLFNNVVKV